MTARVSAPVSAAAPDPTPGTSDRRLDLDEDLALQRSLWRAERVGWGVLGVLVGAALLGATGRGLLSRAEVRASDAPATPRTAASPAGRPPAATLRVEYERILRSEAPTVVRVHTGPNAAVAGLVRVWFDQPCIEHVDLDGILPQPVRTEVTAERVVFVFATAAPGDSATFVFRFSPAEVGPETGRVGLDGGPAVRFRQFLLP